MQDFLGHSLVVGDYVFGGGSYQLFKVVALEDSFDRIRIAKLGSAVDYPGIPSQFVRISEEDLTLYFLTKGYKT